MEGELHITGCLRDCRTVEAVTPGGLTVTGLTATVTRDGTYGAAYHVTFPPTRDLDLWVAAVMRAWEEARAARATLAGELPDWMRPRPERLTGDLRITIRGELRCGKPIPPTGVRPATILVRHAAFPGLDGQIIARAEHLWREARELRSRN